MPRFFVPKAQIPTITGTDVHQIRDVLRLKPGDELELLDGSGKIYFSKITEMKKDKITCEILEHRTSNVERRTQVAIAQCLPKAKKMDLIIQKCTELGAHKIIPTLSERSIAKGEKLERWKKIAKEASEQSGRTTIPEIAPLTNFAEVLKQKKDYDLALIPWELEQEQTLKSVLTTALRTPSTTILILIGPEGGFSQKEIDLAKEAGFTPISLGKRILRTETAGLAIMAMINYQYDQ
ncbi:MAG: 16S rRNA (uracil(1498)-N(3))-methyltransferase [Candidatus Margulisbacteria bacterium]|nr:16S rRNA (uracil(1498)-N(3))-methyltransferase [Candidatus Margulisiibacteriota bacterium]